MYISPTLTVERKKINKYVTRYKFIKQGNDNTLFFILETTYLPGYHVLSDQFNEVKEMKNEILDVFRKIGIKKLIFTENTHTGNRNDITKEMKLLSCVDFKNNIERAIKLFIYEFI